MAVQPKHGSQGLFSKPRRSNRVYHSHSRSRNLLTLPVLSSNFDHRRPSKAPRLTCSSIRPSHIFPILFFLFCAALVIRHRSAPSTYTFDAIPTATLKQSIARNRVAVQRNDELLQADSANASAQEGASEHFHVPVSSVKQVQDDASEQAHQNAVPVRASDVVLSNNAETQIKLPSLTDHSAPQVSDTDHHKQTSGSESVAVHAQQQAQSGENANAIPSLADAVIRDSDSDSDSDSATKDETASDTSSRKASDSAASAPDSSSDSSADTSAKKPAIAESVRAQTPDKHDPFDRDPADLTTFSRETALNYFHLHKTGGVSFKERMFDFFVLYEKFNDRGVKANVKDTCHISGKARKELGIEAEWSCDWGEIQKMPEKDRRKVDVLVGHQYWEHGAGFWLPGRDLRYFTVMRHPLHRKISFYYHFFVRNKGRSEKSVSAEELIQFVLGKKMPQSPLIRDAGPGYYASRLWSDGALGYVNHQFQIKEDHANQMISDSIRRLRRNFVFIGLQTQERASLCMLKKTVEAFARSHGFSSMTGLDQIAKQRERMNTGSYSLSARLLWEKMTDEQKAEFRRVEKVDLGIYKESARMFNEMAKRFHCEHLVVELKDDHIAL